MEKQFPYPKPKPLAEITKNWTTVPENAYPQEIIATVPVSLDLIVGGQKAGKATIAAGKPLKPLKFSGDELKVSTLTNEKLATVINVDDTNFKALVQKRYDEFLVTSKERTDKLRVATKKALIAQERENASKPVSERKSITSDSVAALASGRGAKVSDSDTRLAPVKSSIKSGKIPPKLKQITGYYWNGPENVKGKVYDTVNVTSRVITIFGSYDNEYKCLMSGNKVVGWVNAITGEALSR